MQGASRTREDLVGRLLFDAFPESPDDVEDTGAAALRASLVRVLETGTAQAMPAQRYPIEVPQGSGEVCYEERYWSALNTPIFDENRQLICVSHTTTDITDQVRAELALRESEERLRAYIVATSDVVYRMSPDWKYMHGLDGRGILKTTTEWAEWKMEEYVHPDERERSRAAIETAIRQKSVFDLEHRVLRADGTYGWVIPPFLEHAKSRG
ncbi:hypothetical protein GCM10011572_51490 [Pseudoduganella buxea]|uniref:histidine kinase n=1 Tax=Pseudoduganella buxea TaxID=1949069 RepID=A0ABQ1LGZ5_9BURK|nr:hypothetical protein GCM10011572_51490 [Pseudoduganella buxea]